MFSFFFFFFFKMFTISITLMPFFIIFHYFVSFPSYSFCVGDLIHKWLHIKKKTTLWFGTQYNIKVGFIWFWFLFMYYTLITYCEQQKKRSRSGYNIFIVELYILTYATLLFLSIMLLMTRWWWWWWWYIYAKRNQFLLSFLCPYQCEHCSNIFPCYRFHITLTWWNFRGSFSHQIIMWRSGWIGCLNLNQI